MTMIIIIIAAYILPTIIIGNLYHIIHFAYENGWVIVWCHTYFTMMSYNNFVWYHTIIHCMMWAYRWTLCAQYFLILLLLLPTLQYHSFLCSSIFFLIPTLPCSSTYLLLLLVPTLPFFSCTSRLPSTHYTTPKPGAWNKKGNPILVSVVHV
jgi:hypothetical protein